MIGNGYTLRDVAQVADCSVETLRALAERLEQSTEFQQFIAREIEIDEVWRRVETRLRDVASDPAEGPRRTWAAVFDLIWEAHELAADGNPLDAANRLRQAIAVQQH